MKAFRTFSQRVSVAVLALGLLAGCESSDGGGGSVSGSAYYGVGFYDPWYYGGYDYDYDIIVDPPDRPVSPEHPIAKPPSISTPRPTPMPSIPSTPRPAPRPAMRR